jgi:calcium-dependent protein kinase
MGICSSTKKDDDDNKPHNVKNDEPPTKSKSTQQDNGELKYTRQVINDNKDVAIRSNNLVQLSTGLPLDNYVSDKKLGEGSYGSVYRVKHKDLGIPRAMKKITGSGNKDPEKIKEIENEINLLKSMDHPNIVKIFEFYNTKDGFYLITEYCSGGELFDRILKYKKFDEPNAAYIMFQLLSAVFYCHNQGMIHRDLKPENILIDSEEKDGTLNIKVIDFGTAKLFDKNKTENKVIGSAYYIAPEVLNSKYNEKCDIWSSGVILYILLCGRPPFGGEDEEILDKIKKGKFDLSSDPWPKISNEAKDLIRHMLDMNPISRISAQKALSHKWFKKFKMREKVTNVHYEKLKQSIENIKKFKADNKLQQAALAFLVHNSLYLPEVKDLMKIFKNIDQNGDGKINKEEMGQALSKMFHIPEPEEEVNEIFNNVDNDNNGYIEYEEYIRASINKESLLKDDILKYTFKFFDKDGSGSITPDEVAAVLFQGADKELSSELTLKLIREIDLDDNAQINYEEFKKMMRKLLE